MKLLILIIALAALSDLFVVQSAKDLENKSYVEQLNHETTEGNNDIISVENPSSNSSRVGRILTIYKDQQGRRYGPPPPRILSRADHYPSGDTQQRLPIMTIQRQRPQMAGPRPQLIRRVHIGGPAQQGYHYEPQKNLRFPAGAKDAGLYGGKTSAYRPQFGAGSAGPNALTQGGGGSSHAGSVQSESYHPNSHQGASHLGPSHLGPSHLGPSHLVSSHLAASQQAISQYAASQQTPSSQQSTAQQIPLHQNFGQAGLSTQYAPNFKASPNFQGAIVRPVVEQPQDFAQDSQQEFAQKQQAQQQKQQQKYQEARDQYYTQQQQLNQHEQLAHPGQQFPHYQQQPQQQQEPLLQPKQQHQPLQYEQQQQAALPLYSKTAGAQQQQHSYAVYEDEQSNSNQNNNGQVGPVAGPAKVAQDYLKFMSTNEYFLPKHDPNYKKMDEDRERVLLQQQQHQQLYQQPQPKPYQQPHYQQQLQQQQQQKQYSKPTYNAGSVSSLGSVASASLTVSSAGSNGASYAALSGNSNGASAVSSSFSSSSASGVSSAYNNAPSIKVSQLFYQEDPSPSATIVRGSYQAGNNLFVVSSDGNKAIKHIVPSPLPPLSNIPTSTSIPDDDADEDAYIQPRFGARNRTPEPVRFEFTERDAISPATYTHSPTGQLRVVSAAASGGSSSNNNYARPSTARIPTSTSNTDGNSGSTTTPHGYEVIKPIGDTFDDPEDGEDMHEASSDIFGRVPARVTPTVTSEAPPTEQKDTEDYCERICSNVQDEDEEIVCGSDGYMYTSEAQMECYASCLHIDVTIQSKGSCSAR